MDITKNPIQKIRACQKTTTWVSSSAWRIEQITKNCREKVHLSLSNLKDLFHARICNCNNSKVLCSKCSTSNHDTRVHFVFFNVLKCTFQEVVAFHDHCISTSKIRNWFHESLHEGLKNMKQLHFYCRLPYKALEAITVFSKLICVLVGYLV